MAANSAARPAPRSRFFFGSEFVSTKATEGGDKQEQLKPDEVEADGAHAQEEREEEEEREGAADGTDVTLTKDVTVGFSGYVSKTSGEIFVEDGIW